MPERIEIDGHQPIRGVVAAVRKDICAEVIEGQLHHLYLFLSSTMPVSESQMKLENALKSAWDVAKDVVADEDLTEATISLADDELAERVRDIQAVERAAARGKEAD